MKITPSHFLLPILFWMPACSLFHKERFSLQNHVPPNGVKIAPGLYLDQTEIANIHWLEFLHFVRNDSLSPEDRALLLPDTTVWERLVPDSQYVLLEACRIQKSALNAAWNGNEEHFYPSQYLRYPGNFFRPVVGISPEQAELYGLWRARAVDDRVNQLIAHQGLPYRLRHVFRLPLRSELNTVLHSNPIELVSRDDVKSKCPAMGIAFPDSLTWKANILRKAIWKDTTVLYPKLPQPVSNNKNKNGRFCNLVGNVAELTALGQTNWGGSFLDWVEDPNRPFQVPYREPDCKTGFRHISEFTAVAASTYREESWWKNPRAQDLFSKIRRDKQRLDSTRKAETEFKKKAQENSWRRRLESALSDCPAFPFPVLLNGKRWEHSQFRILRDSVQNNPILVEIPGFTGKADVTLASGEREITTWPLRPNAQNQFRFPGVDPFCTAFIVWQRNEKGATTSWLYLPFRFENKKTE